MDEFRYFIDGVGLALLNFRGSVEKINRNSCMVSEYHKYLYPNKVSYYISGLIDFSIEQNGKIRLRTLILYFFRC